MAEAKRMARADKGGSKKSKLQLDGSDGEVDVSHGAASSAPTASAAVSVTPWIQTSVGVKPVKVKGTRPARGTSTMPIGLDESDSDEEEDDDEDDDDEDSRERKENALTLKRFNEASKKELAAIPRMPANKVNALSAHRPVESWEDLFDVVDSIKGVSTQVIWNFQDMVREQTATKKILSKCSSISKAINDRFGTPSSAEGASAQAEVADHLALTNMENFHGKLVVPKQPDAFDEVGQLKPYQLMGLNWLALLHEQNVNAILADEMGLGKTIQAISFLAYLHEQGNKGPFLIIVPPSTSGNWERELDKWVPHMSVLYYKGPVAERAALRKAVLKKRLSFDIMLTTYSTSISQPDDRSFLRKVKFEVAVLDEGHMLKNMQSQRYQTLMKMRCRRRILLTGTPLQNNLLELMSILAFVMPDVFGGSIDTIKKMFSRKTDGREQAVESLIERAKRIMKPFVLRREKREVLGQLPEKQIEWQECDMTEDQKQGYEQLALELSQEPEDESKKSSALQNSFMQLRKMANHPLLHRRIYTDEKMRKMSREILKDPDHYECDPELVFEDMSVMSDFELNALCEKVDILNPFALPKEAVLNSGKCLKLVRILEEKKREGSRVLVFSQFTTMLDILERVLALSDLSFLRLDGSTPVDERQALIDEFNGDESISCFLLSTKAGGLGINLATANVVILHDIDFNPYNDKQAEDRCHRVGQTKRVEVLKFVSKDTVEMHMKRLAESKLQLEKDIATEESVVTLMKAYAKDVLGSKSASATTNGKAIASQSAASQSAAETSTQGSEQA
eukprot:m.260692 g.260692  ORF g.260692 m.260692 type:complete len:794 (-) comp15565_c1_seq4:4697-7078(-)